MIWNALLEFLIRLSFGLCIGMLCSPPSMIPAGFYRVHLWVLLGLYTLATLFATNQSDPSGSPHLFWLLIVAAGLSYVGAVIWLYERKTAGVIALCGLAAVGFLTLWQAAVAKTATMSLGWGLVDGCSASALLGLTMAAMLLGHWYLNSPGMRLEPLRRLIVLGACSVIFRATICGAGLIWLLQTDYDPTFGFWSTLGLRWLAGLLGIASLQGMTWQTLKIPNTQSATGILYVAVIFSFLGELASQLLSAGLPFPV